MTNKLYPKNTCSLPKSKPMSKAHMPMGSGKMSGAHGVTNGGGKHKTLRNASGSVGSRDKPMGKLMSQGPKKLK